MCDGEGEWLRDGCHTLVTALEHVLTVAEQGGFGEGPERPHTWADSSSPFPAQLKSCLLRLSWWPRG